MQQQPGRDRPEHRPISVIGSELRELERHMAEMPPHHSGGRGASAFDRADRLRRELAAAHAAHQAGQTQDQDQDQDQQ
ncbi:MAG: hypothetical protein ACI970_000308 [Myxococcota bacterium]